MFLIRNVIALHNRERFVLINGKNYIKSVIQFRAWNYCSDLFGLRVFFPERAKSAHFPVLSEKKQLRPTNFVIE